MDLIVILPSEPEFKFGMNMPLDSEPTAVHEMKAVFIFIGLVALSHSAPSSNEEVKKIQKKTSDPNAFRRRQGLNCQVEGRVIPHNKPFVMRAYPCQTYRCNNGGYNVETYRCKDEKNLCYDERAVRYVGCVKQICVVNRAANRVGFQIDTQWLHVCKGADGKCYSHGQIYACFLNQQYHPRCQCHNPYLYK